MPNYTSLTEAATVVGDAERVLVIGCSGGGKTTLAIMIAERFGLPYHSMDRDVFWLPGWRVRARTEQRAILADIVSKDRWVIDGSGPSTFDLRIPRADLIVWVRVRRFVALSGVLRRVLGNYGGVRVAMAKGCPEPIPDRAFLSYIWNFEKESSPRFIEKIDRFGAGVPVVVLKSRGDFAQLLDPKLK